MDATSNCSPRFAQDGYRALYNLGQIESGSSWWIGDWARYGDLKETVSKDDWNGPSMERARPQGKVSDRQVSGYTALSHHREN
jgi:hypothetical protein